LLLFFFVSVQLTNYRPTKNLILLKNFTCFCRVSLEGDGLYR